MGLGAIRRAPWVLALHIGGLVARSEGGELNLTIPLDDTCGVTHRINKLGLLEEADELVCGYEMVTNCTMSYFPMKCPEGCPFLSPSFEFACMFKCVQRCSDYNPERALPDEGAKECRSCHAQNCMECETQHRCRTCHAGFGCQDEGGCRDGEDCTFLFDRNSHLRLIVAVLALAALLLVLFGILWYCVKGPHKNWRMHEASIHRALRHRHLSKVQKWQINDTHRSRKWYNLFVNIHADNIVGVGLGLFYNDIVFMALIALFMCGFTFIIDHTIFPKEILSHFENRWTRTSTSAITNYHLPVEIETALGICAYRDDMGERLEEFARKKCYVLGFMYVCTFLVSLRFGKFQVSWARKFHDRHVTMRDYALRIEGLPRDETDEVALRSWLQDEFHKTAGLAELRRRPAEHELHHVELDREIPRPDTGVEVVGVSICYDYHREEDEVNDVLWNLIEDMEVRLHNEAVDLLSEAHDGTGPLKFDHTMTSACKGNKTLDEVKADDRKRAARWFEGDYSSNPSKLRGAGTAFVIFKYIDDKEDVLSAYKAKPSSLRHPRGDAPLKLSSVLTEPTTVHWWHYGISKPDLYKRACKAILKSLMMIVVVQVFIVLPYLVYVVWPYSKVGQQSTAFAVQIFGIILGNITGFLFWNLHMIATRVGFVRKSHMDVFALCANTTLTAVMTFVNVSIVATMVRHQTNAWAHHGWNGFFNPSLKSLGSSVLLAKNVYHFMYPGTFFMGLIMTALNAGPVIMAWKHFLMKVIYVWRCLPDCLLNLIKPMLPWAPPTLEHYPFRSAELGQDPWEIAILGNYADHIVTPTLCFLLLVTTGGTINQAFLGMLQWALFEYVYFRWLHLRYSKKCFYATGALDSWAKVLWGIPLSVLPVACCVWGYRAHLLPFEGNNVARVLILVAVYNLSLWLWIACYRTYCRPFQREDGRDKNRRFTFHELKNAVLYTWFNTNPVFVLKSQYYFKDEDDVNIDARLKDHPIACGVDDTQVRYYERGKEYLFVKPDRQHLVDVDIYDPLEFEYYLEALFTSVNVGQRYVGKELSHYAEKVVSSVRDLEQVPLLQMGASFGHRD